MERSIAIEIPSFVMASFREVKDQEVQGARPCISPHFGSPLSGTVGVNTLKTGVYFRPKAREYLESGKRLYMSVNGVVLCYDRIWPPFLEVYGGDPAQELRGAKARRGARSIWPKPDPPSASAERRPASSSASAGQRPEPAQEPSSSASAEQRVKAEPEPSAPEPVPAASAAREEVPPPPPPPKKAPPPPTAPPVKAPPYLVTGHTATGVPIVLTPDGRGSGA